MGAGARRTRMRHALKSVALLAAVAGLANAEVVYGKKGILATEKASFAVIGYTGSLVQGFRNADGQKLVQIGTGFQSIGAKVGTSDEIEVKWTEQALATGNFIDVIFRTRHGSDLVPFGSTTGGQAVAFWGWNVGKIDQINFQSWVTDYTLIKATWSYSTNGGTSFVPGGTHTSRLSSPWNGSDPGELLGSPYIGAGINAIQVRYQLHLIPTPGTAAAIGLGCLIAVRRRR